MLSTCGFLVEIIQADAEQPGENEVDDGDDDEREEGVEGAGTDDVAGFGEVLNGDVAHDGGVFDEGNGFAFEYWENVAEGLRQYEVDEGAAFAESQRAAGLHLSVVNTLNASAEHFADVRTEVHRESNDRHPRRRHFRRRKNDVEHHHQENQNGNAAHDFDVCDGDAAAQLTATHA